MVDVDEIERNKFKSVVRIKDTVYDQIAKLCK